MADVEQREARRRYLQAALRQYGVAHIPAPENAMILELEPIYQPLRLRQSPLAAGAERQAAAEREVARAREAPVQETPAFVAAHAEEALERSPGGRLVILGGPGSGKTTTLHRLATIAARRALADAARDAAPLPLYLMLPSLAASGLTLADAAAEAAQSLLDEAGEHVSQVDRDEVARLARDAVERRTAIFLLDGLDEVEPALRGEMIARLNTWASHPGGVWIIGSRYTEYKGGQFTEGRYSEWELLPLDRPARLELARRLLPALRRLGHAGANGSETLDEWRSPMALVDVLEQRPQTRAWAENPLLLSLAALVYAREGALPTRRAGLYDAVVEASLAAREPDAAKRAALRRRLAQAALNLFLQRGRTFTRAQALAALSAPEPSLPVEEAAHALWQVVRAGLIETPSVGPCAFRHLTFQEYLAGEALADGLTAADGTERARAWDLAWSKRLYSRWTEPLRLMTGALGLRVRASETGEERSGQATALRWARALLAQRDDSDGDPGGLGFALAARCVSELPHPRDGAAGVSDALTETQRVVLAAWLRESRRSLAGHDDALTTRAREVATDIGALPATLVDPVIDALAEDGCARVRHERAGMSVFNVIISLRSAYALSRVRALARDPDTEIARAAIYSLGFSGALLRETLEELLANPEWRELVYIMLPPYALPAAALLPYVTDPNVNVRQGIIRALGSARDPAALPVILAALRDTEHPVRQAAALALGDMGDLAPLEPLIAMLDDGNQFITKAGSLVLLTQAARVPQDALWKIARDDYETVRLGALKQLALAGSEEARNALIANLSSGYALIILSEIPNPPLEVFLDLVRNPERHPNLWETAIDCLARIDPDLALPYLREALYDVRDAFHRRNAAVRLLTLGADEIVDGALGELRNRSVQARELAITLLVEHAREIGPQSPPPVLLAALDSAEASVRRTAALACIPLAERGAVFSPATLLRAFYDPGASRDNLLAAARLLKAQGTALPEGVWLALLSSDNWANIHIALTGLAPAGVALPDAVTSHLLDMVSAWQLNVSLQDLARTLTRARRQTLRAALKDARIPARAVATIARHELGEPAPLEWVASAPMRGWRDGRLVAAVISACHTGFSTATLLALARSPHPDINAAAIEALLERDVHLGETAALEAYQAAMSKYPSPILTLLCERGAAAALEPLLQAIEREDTPAGKTTFTRALRHLLARRPDLAAAVRERAATHAREMCGSVVDDVRIEGARLLQTLGLPFDRAPFFALLNRFGSQGYDDESADVPTEVLELLAATGEPLSVEFLLVALRHHAPGVRALAVKLLAERPEASRADVIARIAPLLGDEIREDRESSVPAAYQALRRLAPEIVEEAMAQARALLLDDALGRVFEPAADVELTSALRDWFQQLSPGIFAWLETALDSPHWRVREEAVTVFRQHQRNLPDAIIRRLYALRRDPESNYIRSQADQALGGILSLETGMEDE